MVYSLKFSKVTSEFQKYNLKVWQYCAGKDIDFGKRNLNPVIAYTCYTWMCYVLKKEYFAKANIGRLNLLSPMAKRYYSLNERFKGTST